MVKVPYKIPSSTVGKKATHTVQPTNNLGKGASQISAVMSKAHNDIPHRQVPMNSKLKGNFGTGNAELGAKSRTENFQGNFDCTPKNPRKGS